MALRFRRRVRAVARDDGPGGPSAPPGAPGRLRLERDRFLAFAFAAGSVLIEVAADGRIRFAAGALVTYLGRSAEELIGQALLDVIAPADRGAVALALLRLRARECLLPLPIRVGASGHDQPAMVLTGCRLPQCRGLLHLSLRPAAAGEDVPGRDPDTGLLDQASFERRVVEQLGAAGCEPPLLTFLGLEGLVELAARLQPDAAERLPRQIAGLLQDASGDGLTAARITAERFGMLQEPGVELAGLEAELNASTRAADPLGRGLAAQLVSIPLDTSGLSQIDASKAVRFAIKTFAEQRDFSLHSLRDGFDAMLRDTVARVSNYRDILTADELKLTFQPIVRLSDERTHHYEALTRMADDASPASLVSFAEAIDLVAEFDLSVCRRVIELLQSSDATLKIAVNLSGRSLENQLFVASLFELIDQAGPVRARMMFELTETAEISDLELTDGVVQAIRRRGCEVGLDDFGAGASTFHYLRAFEIDFVKIDGSLIRSTSQRDKAIIKSVVKLCRELDIRTIAEMVETRGQAGWLDRLKVDFAQGFLFGRPSPRLGHGTTRIARRHPCGRD